MNAVSITFTGADGSTRGSDVCLIAECAREYGVDVELALLWSKRNGRERYPTGAQARELYNRIVGEGLHCAMHVCGSRSRKLVDVAQVDEVPAWLNDLWHSGGDHAKWILLLSVIASRGRLQVNVGEADSCLDTGTLLRIAAGLADWTNVPIGKPTMIGQFRGGDSWPASVGTNAAWLYDTSGGRGESPDAWPDLPDYPVGLAGGLGPLREAPGYEPVRMTAEQDARSAAHAARLLAARCGGWVDMESRIRRGGRLDPELCCQVIREVAEALAR